MNPHRKNVSGQENSYLFLSIVLSSPGRFAARNACRKGSPRDLERKKDWWRRWESICVRKCYWSRDYMLIPVHASGLHRKRSRTALRTDKKRVPLA